MEGKAVDIVSTYKHLRVTITSTLQWKCQVLDLLRKGTRRAGLLRRMMSDLPDKVARKLYLFHVQPTVEYVSVVWHGSINEGEAIALERLQARVARRILDKS